MQKKSSEIFQYPFIIKFEKKRGIEGIYLSILKNNYNKRKAKIAINRKKSELIYSKVMKNIRVYALPNIIQHTP
jgi:ribosome-binding factor A